MNNNYGNNHNKKSPMISNLLLPENREWYLNKKRKTVEAIERAYSLSPKSFTSKFEPRRTGFEIKDCIKVFEAVVKPGHLYYAVMDTYLSYKSSKKVTMGAWISPKEILTCLSIDSKEKTAIFLSSDRPGEVLQLDYCSRFTVSCRTRTERRLRLRFIKNIAFSCNMIPINDSFFFNLVEIEMNEQSVDEYLFVKKLSSEYVF